MIIIDKSILDKISFEAKASPCLRMNYNFHQSLEDKCHRRLNAVERGVDETIHRHPTKDESFVLLRGRVRVTAHNDDVSIYASIILNPKKGKYCVDIPKGE